MQSNDSSGSAQFSADGRYVLFESKASNLVAGDTNDAVDVFIKDLQSGAIQRVSTDAAGVQGNGASSSAQFSADGRHVLFESLASNLVAGDSNGANDIFVKDGIKQAAILYVGIANELASARSQIAQTRQRNPRPSQTGHPQGGPQKTEPQQPRPQQQFGGGKPQQHNGGGGQQKQGGGQQKQGGGHQPNYGLTNPPGAPTAGPASSGRRQRQRSSIPATYSSGN